MKQQLDSLKPDDVATYLAARGWRRHESFCQDKASLWFAPPGAREADVLLPLKATVGDYTLRIGALVSEVAAVEGRSALEVVRDVAAVNADVIRVRIMTGHDRSATLPLIDGVNLLKKIRDVLIAAALATIEKKPVFTNRRSETIHEFLDRLRLGQTEYSSFVFTVISPLDEPDMTTVARDVEAPAEPFTRRVTHTLMHALDAMESAAVTAAREGNVDAFLRAVEDGVSGNLCDAVVELKAICPKHPIEFSVAWALAHTPPAGRIDRVELGQESISYIEAASEAFWGIPRAYDFHLEGVIRKLETSENAPFGHAILMGYLDGRLVDVRAGFDSSVYADVVRAWRQRNAIRCEGDLVREDGVLTLKNARYFRVLEPTRSS